MRNFWDSQEQDVSVPCERTYVHVRLISVSSGCAEIWYGDPADVLDLLSIF